MLVATWSVAGRRSPSSVNASATSSDARHFVAVERSILTHDRDILDESLRDKQAIKRIAVAARREWQRAHHRCVECMGVEEQPHGM